MAMDFLCQEMRDACWVSSESGGTVTATKPLSQSGKAVTRKEWDVVREKKSKTET